MKSLYIKDLTAMFGLNREPFAIGEAVRAEDKFGKPYLKLVLVDKTGRIEAKIWNDKLMKINPKICEAGCIVLVTGKVEDYKGKLQINIIDLAECTDMKLDEFVETSEFDTDEMYRDLMHYVDGISHNGLKGVLLEMFKDEEFVKNYKTRPAAKSVHHDFRSGLIQHVLEMLDIAYSMKRFYPMANYDILTAGIILHDIGKFEEMDINGLMTEYSKKGMLVGHISLGAMKFSRYAIGKLSEDLYYHVLHMILSHHGELQYGSPVVPATIEAVMLSYIDRLSDKARCAVKAVREIGEDREFGNYNMFMENARFWKGGNYDDLISLQSPDPSDDVKEESHTEINLVTDEGDQLIFTTDNE